MITFLLASFLATLSPAPHHTIKGEANPYVEVKTSRAKWARDAMEGFDLVAEEAIRDLHLPGFAIALVVDGQLVFAQGYGVIDLEKRQPVNAKTQFPIASCTKGFTSFAAGMLVSEGKLTWDDRVIDWLPDFRMWDATATQKVTLRDLLSHRTGMPRHDFMWYNSDMTKEELMHRIRYLEPVSPFRERYHYNNIMYRVAGEMIEKASGKRWDQFIHERLLEPLGMKETTFFLSDILKVANRVTPYVERNGALKAAKGIRDIGVIGPAGSMNSNLLDLAKWMKFLLDRGVLNGKALINPGVFQEMQTAQTIISGYPEREGDFFKAYSLGWIIEAYNRHHVAAIDGGLEGITNVMMLLPAERIGLVVLTHKNITPAPRAIAMKVLDRLFGYTPSIDWFQLVKESIAKGREVDSQRSLGYGRDRKKGTVPSRPLEEFAGDYSHLGYGKAKVEYDGNDLFFVYNGIRMRLGHFHYDVFRVEEESEDLIISRVGSKIAFFMNEQGEIDGMKVPLESTLPDIYFKRIPEEHLSTISYLRQFIGAYEIYGHTIEIALRGKALYAVIPGQPMYELIPTNENEFIVRGMAGTTIRVMMNGDGEIREALMIQPYGVFTAKPKR